ncbi:MAG TPA: hypothetical protein VM848_19760 [Acidimicrobiia bacterium]|nr:hypothetical protein [Acidimicrobiia bacterium]
MIPPDPGAVLSMWAAGIAAALALVASWKVARPGFILLGTAVTAMIGFLAALAGAGWWAALAALISLLAIYLKASRWAAMPLAGATLLWLDAAGPELSWVIVISGAIALGGITAEMLLGHWYLVDPKLPRRSLKILAAIGAVGIAVDTVLIQVYSVDSSVISPAILIGLGATTVVLMVGVWFSLRVPSYTGVMAATGLSYLATLTALGAVVIGRAVI